MIHDKTIRVGACDWDQPQWLQGFYPQDLPEDWRLSYYANEFSAVLVPQDKWQAEDADFEQWAEDVAEGFGFYFLSDDLKADDTQIKAELGNAFAGFVPIDGNAEVGLINFETKTLREWKEWLLMTKCSALFLVDDELSAKSVLDFQSLVELMGL